MVYTQHESYLSFPYLLENFVPKYKEGSVYAKAVLTITTWFEEKVYSRRINFGDEVLSNCEDGEYLEEDLENPYLYTCQKCHESCKTCTKGSKLDCIECWD